MPHPQLDHLRRAAGVASPGSPGASSNEDPGLGGATSTLRSTGDRLLLGVSRPLRLTFAAAAGLLVPYALLAGSRSPVSSGVIVLAALLFAGALAAVVGTDGLSEPGIAAAGGGPRAAAVATQVLGGATSAIVVLAIALSVIVAVVVIGGLLAALARSGD